MVYACVVKITLVVRVIKEIKVHFIIEIMKSAIEDQRSHHYPMKTYI